MSLTSNNHWVSDYFADAEIRVDEMEAEDQMCVSASSDYIDYADYIELSLALDPTATGWEPPNAEYWRAVIEELRKRSEATRVT
jgi:hypothetical protein